MSTQSHPVSANSPYRHIVMFSFKPETTTEQIAAVEVAFKELKDKVSTIESFEWGINVSPEGKDQGFTHSFLLTFKDREGFDVYLPHPDHRAFSALARPFIQQVLVFDYWAKE